MSRLENSFDIFEFIQWMREYSHGVGYSRLLYLYSDDGVEAKQFLMRLMYLDHKSEWGWYDTWVEYTSAAAFAPRVQTYRSKIEDAQGIMLEPYGSSMERLRRHVCLDWITLALFDIGKLPSDAGDLNSVIDICKALAGRGATVVLTGSDYPSQLFKCEPHAARFLLDGYVAKLSGDRMVLEGERPIFTRDLPFPVSLQRASDCGEDESRLLPISAYDELLFQWELLCVWKDRYSLFDYELFSDAFLGTWRFLLTKPLYGEYQEAVRIRIRLLALMSGFVGGLRDWEFCLFTDDEPRESEVSYGDPAKLAAAEVFASTLIKKELEDKLYKGDGLLKVRFPSDKYWKRSVSFSEFREAIDELASELKKQIL